MKNFIAFFLFTFLSFSIFAQENDSHLRKTEVKGDLLEVTLFYENGEIMQHGFYTKEGKLHASWESYYDNGERKCVATYNYGVKVGIWTYYYPTKKVKVEYDNNKILSVEEVPIGVKEEF